MTRPLKSFLGHLAPWNSTGTLLALALCLLSVAAPAQMPDRQPGIGGTGFQPGEGNGIGGTGHAPGEGNGIGGTGSPQIQATGIIGTITGFGSILVNNYEVDYAANAKAKTDLGEIVDAKSLRVGQVVEIEAEGEGQHLRAQHIAVRYEAVGRIEAIDQAAGTLRVLGQTVAADQARIGASGPAQGALDELAAGQVIYVSGLRRADGVIVASRIDKAASTQQTTWLRGHIDTVQVNGFSLGGVRVAQSSLEGPFKPAAGQEVTVVGTYFGGTFRAVRVTVVPKQPFAGRVPHLSIEGYAGRAGGSGLAVGGLGFEAGQRVGDLRPGDRVILDGRIGNNGRFTPSFAHPAPYHHPMRQHNGCFITPNFHRFNREFGPPRPGQPWHANRFAPQGHSHNGWRGYRGPSGYGRGPLPRRAPWSHGRSARP